MKKRQTLTELRELPPEVRLLRNTCGGCGIPRVLGPLFNTTPSGLPRGKCKKCRRVVPVVKRRTLAELRELSTENRLVRKACAGCGIPRALGPLFYTNSAGLPRTKCKKCTSVVNARWQASNPGSQHRLHLKNRFGISIAQFDKLLKLSDGTCQICREPESRRRRLSLDHNHETGAIRGWLCDRCNKVLGQIKDSVEKLESAIAYLKNPPLAAQQINGRTRLKR